MAAHPVGLGGMLDLDDVGSEVAEDLARERSGEDRGGVNDPEAGERAGRLVRSHSDII